MYIDADANDVTAVTTLHSTSNLVAALGTNQVPGRVHFLVSELPEENTFCKSEDKTWKHDGSSILPSGVGAIRAAASIRTHDKIYFVFGTDQSPGVVVPGGNLKGKPVQLADGEDVVTVALGVSDEKYNKPSFLFATWTTPSRLVRIDIDQDTDTLRRSTVLSASLPRGVNRIRTGVLDPRGFYEFEETDTESELNSEKNYKVAHFVSDTVPSALVTVRTTDLQIIDALVFPVTENGSNVRKGAVRISMHNQSGEKKTAVSYWVTRSQNTPSTLFAVRHDRVDGGGARIIGRYDFSPYEQLVTGVAVEQLGGGIDNEISTVVVYVTFDTPNRDGQIVVVLVETIGEGESLQFSRKGAATIPDAKATSLISVTNGLANYVTRGSPAELIEIDYLGWRQGTGALDEEVFALSGPEVTTSLCVVFLNQTHFGATALYLGEEMSLERKQAIADWVESSNSIDGVALWSARPC